MSGREGGSEVKARSQDIGLVVLVTVLNRTNFSVKRRMRPACPAGAGWDSSNAFILRFAGGEGFLFWLRLFAPPTRCEIPGLD